MRLTAVVGNPKPSSRTRAVAEAVLNSLQGALGTPADTTVVDLARIAARLFDTNDAEVHATLQVVGSSDLVVVASPTYKATYTGILKSFFDLYANNALSGTVAVPVMTGAASIHALAVELHLRPLLVELGASVPARGLFVTEDQFDRMEDVMQLWSREAELTVAAVSAQREIQDRVSTLNSYWNEQGAGA